MGLRPGDRRAGAALGMGGRIHTDHRGQCGRRFPGWGGLHGHVLGVPGCVFRLEHGQEANADLR